MVSEQPEPGRCGATVFDKVGLEVHDDVLDEMFHTGDDGTLVEVVIERGAVTAHKEPEYDEVLPYLREGFALTAVKLRPSEASEDDDPVHIDIDDDDPYVTNHDTDVQGYCERYPVKSRDKDVCPVHGGGEGTGGQEDNLNAMTHGLYAKRSSYYEQLSENDKLIVEQFVDDWLELSSYTWDNNAIVNELYRIAVDQIRLWEAQDEFDKGLIYEQMADYDIEDGKIYADQENPANLPYDRLDRTTFGKLKDLGVLDDPESQQAEATESLAQKFADIDS
jgi:hypothetical protein